MTTCPDPISTFTHEADNVLWKSDDEAVRSTVGALQFEVVVAERWLCRRVYLPEKKTGVNIEAAGCSPSTDSSCSFSPGWGEQHLKWPAAFIQSARWAEHVRPLRALFMSFLLCHNYFLLIIDMFSFDMPIISASPASHRRFCSSPLRSTCPRLCAPLISPFFFMF